MLCYICKKEIKKDQLFVNIGKGLIRHKRCTSGKARNIKKESK